MNADLIFICVDLHLSAAKNLVTKLLTYHQPTHSTVHNANPNTPEFTSPKICRMARWVHQAGMGQSDCRCEGEILTWSAEAEIRRVHAIEWRESLRSIVCEVAARKHIS